MQELVHAQTEKGIRFMAGRWPMNPDMPTVIFIHGANLSKLLWSQQVRSLARCANTLALDLPGHGQSHGPGRNTITEYAEVTREFIEELEIARPVLCGLSMGGAIAQHMLIHAPADFQAAVLISTGAKLTVMPFIFDSVRKDYQNYINMLAQFMTSPKSDPQSLMAVMTEAVQCLPGTVIGDFEACDAFDVMGKLEAIQVPVLVITGDDDTITPPPYGDYLAAHIANAQRIRIADAGHLVPIERGRQVSQAIDAFLERVCA